MNVGGVLFAAVFCLFVGGMYWGVSALFRPSTRNRILREYGLPVDDPTVRVVDRFVRTFTHGEAAGAALAMLGVWALPFGSGTARHHYQLPVFTGYVVLYGGVLGGGAVACALALRRGSVGTRRRASLVPRDAVDYLPRRFVTAGFACAGLCLVAGVVALAMHDLPSSVAGAVACVMAIAACVVAVLLPFAQRLARMPMPVEADHDEAIGDALRAASVRLVAGNSVGIAFIGAGVTVAAALQASGWLVVVPLIFWALGLTAVSGTRPGATSAARPRRLARYFMPRRRVAA